jgi:hypothetical protein
MENDLAMKRNELLMLSASATANIPEVLSARWACERTHCVILFRDILEKVKFTYSEIKHASGSLDRGRTWWEVSINGAVHKRASRQLLFL